MAIAFIYLCIYLVNYFFMAIAFIYLCIYLVNYFFMAITFMFVVAGGAGSIVRRSHSGAAEEPGAALPESEQPTCS